MDIRKIRNVRDYGTITKEAPSCYYQTVEYAAPRTKYSALPDSFRLTPKPSELNSQLSIPPATPSRPVTAKLQHSLYMFPSRDTKTQDPSTVEPVDFICMQIKGDEQKVTEGRPVVYSGATIGIFTRITDGPLQSKGTHHLNLEKNTDVTISMNHGTLTLDARTKATNAFGNLENAPVLKGQRVYKDSEDGNTLVWRNMFGDWTGLKDATSTKAKDLWPEPAELQWSPPSLLGMSAGPTACGGIEDRSTAGSMQSGEGAVSALSSLC